MIHQYMQEIERLWQSSPDTWKTPYVDTLLQSILNDLDCGLIRVATPPKNHGESWTVNTWVKHALLMLFRTLPMQFFEAKTQFDPAFYDKFVPKTASWAHQNFQEAGFRLVHGANVRQGAYIARHAIIMPSFINIGAYIDEHTMIDAHAMIGSCAQIGKRCHISTGVKIGGVLEPPQAFPVIIEDDVFIGAGCHVMEGVHVHRGAVLGTGVVLNASTRIIDRQSGTITYGSVPENAVIAPGSYVSHNAQIPISLSCAVIIKYVDAQTRARTSLSEWLRDDAI